MPKCHASQKSPAPLKGALPWVGSKRQLRDTILARIPDDHTCYVEPFAGAAWVYLGKQPSKVEVLNDLNGNLVNLYKIVRDRPLELFDTLWFMLPHRQSYQESKAVLQTPIEAGQEVQRAALFYYHINNAFGAKFGGGFAFSKVRPPRHVLGYDLLIRLHERLQNTYLDALDFSRIFKNYDAPDTFFYLDPPYLLDDGKKDKCYQHEFTWDDHVRLADAIKKLSGRWLLSYSDQPKIRELYRGCKIEETDPVNYTLSGRSQYKRELLISV